MAKYVTINTKVKKIVIRGAPGAASVPSDPTFNSVTLNPLASAPASPAQGQAWWDQQEETWSIKQDGATLQVGQEVQWPVRNQTGTTILNGTVVMAIGTQGATGRILIGPMDGTDPANAKFVLGIATHDIANAANGKVTAFGKVRDIDTSVWSEGDVLYIDSTSTDGEMVNVKPVKPGLNMPIAFVINDHAVNGVLSVRVTPIDENIWTEEAPADGKQYAREDLTWTEVTGDVSAAANMTDNTLIKGDGGAKGVQDSGIVITDTDTVYGANAEIVNKTAAYGFVLGDEGKTFTMDGAFDFTIPAESSIDFPIGTFFNLNNIGGDAVSVALTTDTLLPAASPTGITTVATVKKTAAATWMIYGDLA